MINELFESCKKENIKIEVGEYKNKNNWIEIFNDKLIKFVTSNNVEYSLNSIYNDKVIKTKVSNLNKINEIVESIKRNVELSDNTDETSFAKKIDIKEKKLNRKAVDTNEVKEFLLSLNDLKEKYNELSAISSYYSYEKNEISIINDEVNLKDVNESVSFEFELVVKKESKTETTYFSIFDSSFDSEIIFNKIIEKLNDVINRLDATSIKTMKTKVLLTNRVVYDLLRKFSSMYEAKRIRLNISPLTGKLNKKVFSDKINIIEDPSNESYVTSRLFDGEGTKTYKKEIIKDGIFKTIIYDNKESIKANTSSTGNSFGLKNCYIVPGNKTFDELINIMNNGIIIDRIDGLHSGSDGLKGDISVQCQGYEVKNGKKDKPIKMFVLTTSIFELFSNVIELGNDLEIFSSFGGACSMLSENINISGSN